MIKCLSRDLFPLQVGLFLIFCLQEGISEDLKIWHTLFRQGLGRSRDRAGRRQEAQDPPWASWASSLWGLGVTRPTAVGISSQVSPAEQTSCSGVKGDIFPLLNKILSHYYRNVSCPKDFLKQSYWGFMSSTTQLLPPLLFVHYWFKSLVLLGTEISAFVVLWGPHTDSVFIRNIY